MNKSTLHYAKLNDIDVFEQDFQTLESMIVEAKFILLNNEHECVYLMTYNSGKDRREHDITISTKIYIIQDAIDYYGNNIMNLFIQEYDSFESAYRVAISMQETHKLCYGK